MRIDGTRLALLLLVCLFGFAAAGQPPTVPTNDPAAGLPEGAFARVGSARFRHADEVTFLDFSPDGKRIVSAARQDRVKVWDAATGKLIAQLSPAGLTLGHQQGVRFSVDGASVLAVCTPRVKPLFLVRYDFASGREQRIDLPVEPMPRFGLNHDGTRIAVGSPNTISVHDTRSGQKLVGIAWAGHNPYEFAFSADGHTIAVTAGDDAFCLFDTKTGKRLRELKVAKVVFETVSLSADGKTAATTSRGDANSDVFVWDLTVGKLRHRLRNERWNESAALSRDGKQVAACQGSRVVIWDAVTGREQRTMPLPGTTAYRAVFSPDGRTLAVGGYGHVTLWNVPSGRMLPQSADPPALVENLQFRDEGKSLFGWFGRNQVRDVTNGRVVREIPASPDDMPHVYAVMETGRVKRATQVCSADLTRVFSATQDGRLHVTDTATGKRVRILDSVPGMDVYLLPSTDGKLLYVRDPNGRVQAWDVDRGKVARQFEDHGAPRVILELSADGRRLATATYRSSRPSARVLDAKTGKRLFEAALPGHEECVGTTAVGLSADGRRLAVASWVQGPEPVRLQVWDVDRGQPIVRCVDRGFDQTVYALAFSPDGRTVATGGDNGILRVWEVASGAVRHRFRHGAYITSVTFTPDGCTLAASSMEAPVFLWDLDGSRTRGVKPMALSFDAAWAALANADAKSAFDGCRALIAGGGESVRLIRGQLKPIPPPDPAQVRQWIADLGHAKFEVREKATSELTRLIDVVWPALREAVEKSESAEIRARARRILPQPEGTTPEMLRAVRSLEVLERIGTADAKRLLAELGGGAEGSRLTREARAAARRLQ